MEPYIDLFLIRPVWVTLGLIVFVGIGFFLTKDQPTSYSWKKANTSWSEYVLWAAALACAVVLICIWGLFPFLYWLMVVSMALTISILVYVVTSAALTAEHVPAKEWLDASSVRFKKMSFPGHILTVGLGIIVFCVITLAGIHLAL